MDLERAIDAGAKRYEQRFLVVHVITGTDRETFMVTKIPGCFPGYNCYDVPTLVSFLKARGAQPKRIGVANSPFASVEVWSELS